MSTEIGGNDNSIKRRPGRPRTRRIEDLVNSIAMAPRGHQADLLRQAHKDGVISRSTWTEIRRRLGLVGKASPRTDEAERLLGNHSQKEVREMGFSRSLVEQAADRLRRAGKPVIGGRRGKRRPQQ